MVRQIETIVLLNILIIYAKTVNHYADVTSCERTILVQLKRLRNLLQSPKTEISKKIIFYWKTEIS